MKSFTVFVSVPALRQPGTRRRPNAKDLGISSFYTVPSCSGQRMWHFNDNKNEIIELQKFFI
jgi:hypothetical protein